MRIIIAGGTGFVGSELVKDLTGNGYEVILMVRPGSKSIGNNRDNIKTINIDPSMPIANCWVEADAIINLVGIIREFPLSGITFKKAHCDVTHNLIDFAARNNIKRFLQMSALGVVQNANTGYLKTKYLAEEDLRESELDWTIFRPSMIFGEKDLSINMFASMVKNLPVVPVIGDGKYRVQPIFIGDVCKAFSLALSNQSMKGKTIEVGGPEIFSFDQMLDTIGEVLGKRRVRKIHVPVFAMRIAASIFGGIRQFPITNDQITMLLNENYTGIDSFLRSFATEPAGFKKTLSNYLK